MRGPAFVALLLLAHCTGAADPAPMTGMRSCSLSVKVDMI